MKATIWFRALAVVLAFFTLGHTVGTRHAITNMPQEQSVITAMQSYQVPVMGFHRSYWEFYRGFSVSITILLAALMVLAWQLGTLSRRDPRSAFPLALTLLAACIAQAVLTFVYFFTAPIITSVLAVLCAGIATAIVARDARAGGTSSNGQS